MTEKAEASSRRKLWVRGFFMLLIIMIIQLAGTVIFIVTVFQFVMMLLINETIPRLVSFSRNLSRYLQKIANFLTFTAEDIPFPFSDWPTVEE